MTEPTIGQRLQALRKRSGLSLDAVAKAAGFAGASSVQTYFDAAYNPDGGLPRNFARKMMQALSYKGEPPIRDQEIMTLVWGGPTWESEPLPEYLTTEIAPVPAPTPTLRGQPKDVPVYGTALGADIEIDANGLPQAIELTTVEMGEALTYVRRPPGLSDQQRVYAVFVVGSSMEPRYRAGDPVFVDPHRPPSIGDDVIVQVTQPNGDGGRDIVAGLIKTLTRRNARVVELEQYNPGTQFAIETANIAAIHRIIPWRECFGI